MIYLGLQNLLFPYCPTIVNRIGRFSPYWQDINERYARRINFIDAEFLQKGPLDIEVSMFELIYQVIRGSRSAQGFLLFIDSTVAYLERHLSTKHQAKLTSIVCALIENFKSSEFSSNYASAIGELCFLYNILNLPNLPFNIETIELRLPNGKKVDCHIKNVKTGGEIYVDILNIHVKPGRLLKEEDIRKFIFGRISKKRADKLIGLEGTEYDSSFGVAPILWCDLEEMKKFEAFFNSYPEEVKGVPCMSIAQFHKEDGSYGFEFHTMASLLSRLKISTGE